MVNTFRRAPPINFHDGLNSDGLNSVLQGCKIGHLDRPYKDWPLSVGATPAAAMRLPEHGRLKVGGPANFILFSARCFSELLSRPHLDRASLKTRPGACLHAPEQLIDFRVKLWFCRFMLPSTLRDH